MIGSESINRTLKLQKFFKTCLLLELKLSTGKIRISQKLLDHEEEGVNGCQED